MKFPKVIYVVSEKESNDLEGEYLSAHQDLAEVGVEGDMVGVYKLFEVKKKKVTEELV